MRGDKVEARTSYARRTKKYIYTYTHIHIYMYTPGDGDENAGVKK